MSRTKIYAGASAFALSAVLALSAANVYAETAAEAPAAEAATEAVAPAVAPVAREPASEAAAPAAEAAPAAAEAAPAAPEAPQSVVVTAKDLKVGTPVFSVDGTKIGEVNRISSTASGEVSEIQVTKGTPAGLNAEAVSVPAEQIIGLKDGVKLSLSADQAKSLPVVDGSNG